MFIINILWNYCIIYHQVNLKVFCMFELKEIEYVKWNELSGTYQAIKRLSHSVKREGILFLLFSKLLSAVLYLYKALSDFGGN